MLNYQRVKFIEFSATAGSRWKPGGSPCRGVSSRRLGIHQGNWEIPKKWWAVNDQSTNSPRKQQIIYIYNIYIIFNRENVLIKKWKVLAVSHQKVETYPTQKGFWPTLQRTLGHGVAPARKVMLLMLADWLTWSVGRLVSSCVEGH